MEGIRRISCGDDSPDMPLPCHQTKAASIGPALHTTKMAIVSHTRQHCAYVRADRDGRQCIASKPSAWDHQVGKGLPLCLGSGLGKAVEGPQ